MFNKRNILKKREQHYQTMIEYSKSLKKSDMYDSFQFFHLIYYIVLVSFYGFYQSMISCTLLVFLSMFSSMKMTFSSMKILTPVLPQMAA